MPFYVIEGSDGSGKGTQFELLVKNLRDEGVDVKTYDFPRYNDGSSYFVKKYLNGEYGGANSLNAEAASLFFALDRFDAANDIKTDLESGKIVLANRFTASNMAHQGQKIDDETERHNYYAWLESLEFTTLGVPRPDKNIVLLVPAETAQKLVDQKATRNYTDQKRDIHEADLNHLKRAVATYEELCELYPDDFAKIICTKETDELRSIDDIQAEIRSIIAKFLPNIPTR